MTLDKWKALERGQPVREEPEIRVIGAINEAEANNFSKSQW